MTNAPSASRMSSAPGVVGPLAASATIRADAGGVLGGDGIFQRRGDQDVAIEFEQFLVGEEVAARHSHQAALLLLVLQSGDGIEALRLGCRPWNRWRR